MMRLRLAFLTLAWIVMSTYTGTIVHEQVHVWQIENNENYTITEVCYMGNKDGAFNYFEDDRYNDMLPKGFDGWVIYRTNQSTEYFHGVEKNEIEAYSVEFTYIVFMFILWIDFAFRVYKCDNSNIYKY